ncbi:MAG: hypothetical protein RXR03_01965 [Thermocladium sp.]
MSGLVLDPLEYELTRAMYTRIPGLDFQGDEAAAKIAPRYCNASINELRELDWSETTIVMPAIMSKPIVRGLLVAVEGRSLSILKKMGLDPQVVVTDFDYEPDELIGYSGLVLGHAHGDNGVAFTKYAPLMERIIPTIQSWPQGCSILPPGFTDGDRAVYLAAYLGAEVIHVYGFRPGLVIKRDDAIKRAKLALASVFIKRASRLTDVRIY